jgi:hypothetical protein
MQRRLMYTLWREGVLQPIGPGTEPPEADQL